MPVVTVEAVIAMFAKAVVSRATMVIVVMVVGALLIGCEMSTAIMCAAFASNGIRISCS